MFFLSMTCSLYSQNGLHAVGNARPHCFKFFDGNAVAPTTRGPTEMSPCEVFVGRGVCGVCASSGRYSKHRRGAVDPKIELCFSVTKIFGCRQEGITVKIKNQFMRVNAHSNSSILRKQCPPTECATTISVLTPQSEVSKTPPKGSDCGGVPRIGQNPSDRRT